MATLTRTDIRDRLTLLDDRWINAAFAARMAMLALPALTIGSTGSADFLGFWGEKAGIYLLALFRAWQGSWSAALYKDLSFRVAAPYRSAIEDANRKKEYGAEAVVRAVRASAAPRDGRSSFEAAKVVAAAAYATAAAYADAIRDALLVQAADYLEILEKNRDAARFLNQPFEDFDRNYKELQNRFLDRVSSMGNGFDYWSDWYKERRLGIPVDREILAPTFKIGEEILAKEPAGINAYLRSLRTKEAIYPLNRVRAIFVGFPASGKTSVIRTLNNEAVIEGKERPTPGIDVRTWRVPPVGAIQADLWDFGGQVIYHATHRFFLRQRCLYVIVLDGEDLRRRERNATEDAEYWLEHVRAYGANSPVIILGNKADIAPIALNQADLREKYPNIVGFYSMSCIGSNSTHKAEFERFHHDFSAHLHGIETGQILLTKGHFDVLKGILQLSSQETFLKRSDFDDLCDRFGVPTRGSLDRDWLLDLLDKLGIIIHFPDLPFLNDFLLNPRWLTYGIYSLLNSEIVSELGGTLDFHTAQEVLSSKEVTDNIGNRLRYEANHCRFILKAMERFELGYQLPGNRDGIMVPSLLPLNTPRHTFDKSAALAFDFDFEGILPRHVISSLTVRRHKEIARCLANGIHELAVWQNGVHLHSATFDAEALVESDYHARRLSLWVNGKQASRYFSVLHDNVMEILSRLPDISPWQYVRLSSEDHRKRASFRDLLAHEKRGETRYICEHGVYALDDLLKIWPQEKRKQQYVAIFDSEVEVNMGSEIRIDNSGILNWKSNLENTIQLVRQASAPGREIDKKLLNLVEDLRNALSEIPDEHADKADAIQKLASQGAQEAVSAKPNRAVLNVTASGLKEAAETLAVIAPTVFSVVNQIATFFTAR